MRTKDYQAGKVAKDKVNIGATVSKDLWLRLRAVAIRQGKLSGDLLDEAIADYLKKVEGR